MKLELHDTNFELQENLRTYELCLFALSHIAQRPKYE